MRTAWVRRRLARGWSLWWWWGHFPDEEAFAAAHRCVSQSNREACEFVLLPFQEEPARGSVKGRGYE